MSKTWGFPPARELCLDYPNDRGDIVRAIHTLQMERVNCAWKYVHGERTGWFSKKPGHWKCFLVLREFIQPWPPGGPSYLTYTGTGRKKSEAFFEAWTQYQLRNLA